MDKTIITTLLVIAGVIVSVLAFNTIYPAVIESSDTLTNRQRRINERLNSQIEIIHAAKASGYDDVVTIWVKNIGANRISPVENCDLFFGPEGNYSRIPHGIGEGFWSYTVENDSDWDPAATVRITAELDYSLIDGERYFVKFVTSRGVDDEYYFSN